jgi:hypothetical protein
MMKVFSMMLYMPLSITNYYYTIYIINTNKRSSYSSMMIYSADDESI